MTPRRARSYVAAGAVVVDGDRVLVLRRPSRDEVRLPKGHVDDGESPEEAAVRETGEESGHVDLELVTALGTQRVQFEVPEGPIDRVEHFFLYRLTGPTTRSRNHHDRKFEPEWVHWTDALEAMTFEPEREWIRRAASAAGVNLD